MPIEKIIGIMCIVAISRKDRALLFYPKNSLGVSKSDAEAIETELSNNTA